MMSVLLLLLIFFTAFSAYASNITVVWDGEPNSWQGTLIYLGRTMKCSVGSHGVSSNKTEGDGSTPAGSYLLRRAFFRSDKIDIKDKLYPTFLNMSVTHPDYGWIDDPTSSEYNTFTTLPVNVSHENLFLTDSNAYDLMAVVGYNDDPPIPYLGSAIFFHVTDTYGPTAGCIALSLSDLEWVLERVTPDTYMIIS